MKIIILFLYMIALIAVYFRYDLTASVAGVCMFFLGMIYSMLIPYKSERW